LEKPQPTYKPKPWHIILGLTIAIQLLTYRILPPLLGQFIYIAHPILWSLLALTTLIFFNREKNPTWQLDSPLLIFAATIALIQILASIIIGLLTSLGRSPYDFTPLGITINLTRFISTLFGFELARAYLIKTWSHRPTLAIGVTAFLYSPTSLLLLSDASNAAEMGKLLSSTYLPNLTQNLLASYLAFLGGPVASMTYMGSFQAFEWISPILPDPPWALKSLIGVMIPTLGFLLIHQSVLQTQQQKGTPQPEKSPLPQWTVIGMVFLLAIWVATGHLGVYPTVIVSGSMQPTLNVGDLTIVLKTQPQKIKPNDIIQFHSGEINIVHRVIDIRKEETTNLFITKGDANKAPDTDPVKPNQVIGKVVLVIPKIGWVTIMIRSAYNEIARLLSNLGGAGGFSIVSDTLNENPQLSHRRC